MNEHLDARQRRREMLITLSFTIFSVLMIIITAIEQWPIFYVPLIFAELAYVWWSYVTGFQIYIFRAFMVTTFVNLNVFLYGIHGENFFVLIPTLCVEFVLLSLYEMPRILDVSITKDIVLFLYHILIKGYTLPEGHLERNRIMLQSLSLVVLMALCIYRIHHHLQEERDVVDLENQVFREQRIKDDFVANTSHELRTPVNTISGMCEILLQKSLPEDIHSGILDIQMTGVELQNIVTDILDYSALEAGTLELAPRAYNITSTLNDVMNMTVFENKEKQLEIIFDCDPNIPCLLEGDEQQLRRVLNDLIGNAIKFTSEGGVIVRVTYRPEEYGINLIFSIRDTGVGLSLDEQERIFRDFYQTDSDRNRKSSGIGLGLTLSSALIKKMGGFLTIKSQPGKGSEFAFAIPQKVLNDRPCISLQHPGLIRLIWFYNSQSAVPTMRDAFVEHIRHFSEYFGILSHRAATLEECRRRVAQTEHAHLIVGQKEYLQDKAYFDRLAEVHTIILIADQNETLQTTPRIHVLYKPYNAIMLAEIFNGREQTVPVRKKVRKKFVAPDAKILVVDDNLMNLKVVEGLLRKYRIKIVAATSGEEALSMIESQDYDFVFMDHMMPGMDGVECFHRIREKQGAYYAWVPIIALTANAIAGSREMFLSEGFNEFVAKPIDTTLLNDVLLNFIPVEKQLDPEKLEEEEAEKGAAAEQKAETGSVEKDTSARIKEALTTPKTETPAPPSKPVPAEPAPAPVPLDAAQGEEIFDHLPGIDKETALMYCGSVEDFLELAEVYCGSGKTYAKDLQTAFDNMDLKNYGLISHTVKSTSKTLGALELSDLALGQEMAAKGEDEETVRSNHETFLAEYHRVLFVLSGSPEGEVPDVDPGLSWADAPGSAEIADWPAVKAELMRCLKSYEMNAFEECLNGVKGQTLNGKPIEDVLSGVIQKASEFDFEGAAGNLSVIGGVA